MHDETKERMRKDRDTTKRAECFGRLVLTNREDHDGRKLLDYAERTADRLPMQWEKTIAWLSLALRADGVDETTLTGIGFDRQEVRHATIVQPRENEPATAYAERLAAYNEPEAFAVGEALLDETAETNPTVPTGTTNTARDAGIDRLRRAHKEWAHAHRGDRPQAPPVFRSGCTHVTTGTLGVRFRRPNARSRPSAQRPNVTRTPAPRGRESPQGAQSSTTDDAKLQQVEDLGQVLRVLCKPGSQNNYVWTDAVLQKCTCGKHDLGVVNGLALDPCVTRQRRTGHTPSTGQMPLQKGIESASDRVSGSPVQCETTEPPRVWPLPPSAAPPLVPCRAGISRTDPATPGHRGA